jgi:hypothetical protein
MSGVNSKLGFDPNLPFFAFFGESTGGKVVGFNTEQKATAEQVRPADADIVEFESKAILKGVEEVIARFPLPVVMNANKRFAALSAEDKAEVSKAVAAQALEKHKLVMEMLEDGSGWNINKQ